MSTDNKVFVASDHNGNAFRNYVVRILEGMDGFECEDLGPFAYEGKVDYIDYAEKLCRLVLDNPGSKGVLICGTGAGMVITANRFPGIRATIIDGRATAILSREHNNSNVMVLGAWRTSIDELDGIVEAWLTTPFGEERHVRRLKKLEELKP